MRLFVIVSFACVVSTSLVLAKESKCGDNSDRKADLTVSKILTIGNTGRRFPENQQQVPKYCKDTFGFVGYMDNYTKTCLESFTKQVASVLVYTIQSQARGLCAKKSKRLEELLDSATCVNRGTNEMQKCNIQLIDTFMGIKRLQNDKAKIPMVCCAYFKMLDCVRSRLGALAGCTEAQIEYTVRFIEAISGSAVDLLCPNRDVDDSSNKCRLSSVPRKARGERRPKSYILPLIDILDSIPEAPTS